MATQNDNFRIEAGKPIDDRYTRFGLAYVDIAEVNATIVISRRYKGLTVLVGNLEYWYLEGITDADLVIKTTGGGTGGSGASASGKFIFSTDVTTTDPGDGKLKFNNIGGFSVTEIYIDKFTTDLVDIGALLENLATNDSIRIQKADEDDNNIIYKLTGTAVDNDGWWTIPVVFMALTGPVFEDLEPIVAIAIIGGGGVNTVTGAEGVTVDNTDPQNPVVELGGEVTEYAEVWSQGSTPDLKALLGVGGGYASLQALNESTNDGIAIKVGEEEIKIIDDTPVPKGLQNAADYSATFTDRSLVDKEYVDRTVVDWNVDGGTAASIYNTIPVIDGGGP